MSLKLFGLYLDDLQATLQNTPDSACPMLGDTTLPVLLYADPVTLTRRATTPDGRAAAFCHSKRLTVYIEKTKAMVCWF